MVSGNPDGALRKASCDGDHTTLKDAIENGADINATDENGVAALHLACFHGNTECVHVLLGSGSQADLTNKSGQTGLHLAATQGHLDVVIAMCDVMGDLNTPTKTSQMTALHLAARRGHTDICDFLLKKGANRDAKDQIGKPAIFYASYLPTKVVFLSSAPPTVQTDKPTKPPPQHTPHTEEATPARVAPAADSSTDTHQGGPPDKTGLGHGASNEQEETNDEVKTVNVEAVAVMPKPVTLNEKPASVDVNEKSAAVNDNQSTDNEKPLTVNGNDLTASELPPAVNETPEANNDNGTTVNKNSITVNENEPAVNESSVAVNEKDGAEPITQADVETPADSTSRTEGAVSAVAMETPEVKKRSKPKYRKTIFHKIIAAKKIAKKSAIWH